MPPAPIALLLAAVVAAPGPAEVGEADEVRPHLQLRGRFTDRENLPSPSILYDRAARAFDVGSYLRPQGSDVYPSALVSAGLEGRHGRFQWALTADTGELRSTRARRLSAVCATTLAPPGGRVTGLDVLASGRCNVNFQGRPASNPPSVALEDTRLDGAQLSSNGRPFEDELGSTLLLREAWVGATLGRNDFALVRAGRKRFTVADGFIYDDYGLGVEASLDLGALGPSFAVGAAAFYPTRDWPGGSGLASPMVALRADWLPSLFEHVGVFAALFRDRMDSVAGLFQASFAEPSVVRLLGTEPGTAAHADEARALAAILGAPGHSRGTVAWFGTSGHLRLARATLLDWTGALQWGSLTLSLADGARQVQGGLSGQLAWLQVRHRPLAAVEVSSFLLFLSGDLPPTERQRLGLPERYGGFLGISPYVTATNLFFQGGVSETFASRQATAPGVNGRGVFAPGLGAAFDPLPSLGVALRGAYLVAPEQGPFGGRVYGPEVDLDLQWSPRRWITFLVEADALWPGDFFPGHDLVRKLVLGVDLTWM